MAARTARLPALSPRGHEPELPDLAPIEGLTAGQRVRRRRTRRGLLRRARRVAVVAGVLLLGGTGVGLAVAGGRVLLTAPRFAVTHVEVRGVSRLRPEEVIAAAGLAHGENLFRIDTAAVRMAVEALPAVRRVDVIRAWPNRLTLVVEERRPFTLVHAGHLHWVDEDGVVIGEQARAVAVPLPVISGLSPDELAGARRAPSARVATGLALIRTLLRAGSPLTSQISEVDVGRHDGPVLYTVDGVEVRLGAEEWESRIPRLAGVLAQLTSSGEAVSAIDLRFRDQVVLRPAVR